jgi:hypothetical protein
MEEKSNPYRDSISDLLAENDIDINADVDANTLTFKRAPSPVKESESKALVKAKEKAENVMTSLLRLYLSDGFISKSEYVQAKVNLDSMTLGKIMNQMEVSERAISLLMENIEMGDINPKLFDALGNLQRTFIDLVKTQTNYVATAEEDYRKIALEKDSMSVEDTTATEVQTGFKSSSQKDLMRMIRTTVANDKKEKGN